MNAQSNEHLPVSVLCVICHRRHPRRHRLRHRFRHRFRHRLRHAPTADITPRESVCRSRLLYRISASALIKSGTGGLSNNIICGSTLYPRWPARPEPVGVAWRRAPDCCVRCDGPTRVVVRVIAIRVEFGGGRDLSTVRIPSTVPAFEVVIQACRPPGGGVHDMCVEAAASHGAERPLRSSWAGSVEGSDECCV